MPDLCPERKAVFGSQDRAAGASNPTANKNERSTDIENFPSQRWCITAVLCYEHRLELSQVQ